MGIRNIVCAVLDFIVPPRVSDELVRALTLEHLHFLRLRSPESEGLPYQEKEIAMLIWELKYRANPRAVELAGAYLAEELVVLAAEELGTPLLIPIPLHPERRRERGFNQTELLCENVLDVLTREANGSQIPFEYAPDVLVRTRHTTSQQELSRQERLKNIQHSMTVVHPQRVEGRVCFVVDDVTTTGATLKEAQRALRTAGARRIHCIALARS